MLSRKHPCPTRRAAVVVVTMVMLPVILGFAALAIDIGITQVVRTELQRAADAAALAAVQHLKGSDTPSALQDARTSALDLVGRNSVFGNQTGDCDINEDIVFGRAILGDTGLISFTPGDSPSNAVRVNVHLEVPYTLGAMFGFTERTISASALAGIGPRDYMVVIDCSGSMTKQSDDDEVYQDLLDLGIPVPNPSKAKKVALDLTYDGTDPEFSGVYAIGEDFLPPTVRIQPLQATKAAAAFGITAIESSGYSDLVGAVAFSSDAEWTVQLTDDYDLVRAKLRGATKYGGTRIDLGLEAARLELLSDRVRPSAEKVIVLMTDGNSSAPLTLNQAQLAVDAGMTIHTVGLGTNVDVDHMTEIAALGGGVFMLVEDITDPDVYGPALANVFELIGVEQVGIRLMLLQ